MVRANCWLVGPSCRNYEAREAKGRSHPASAARQLWSMAPWDRSSMATTRSVSCLPVTRCTAPSTSRRGRRGTQPVQHRDSSKHPVYSALLFSSLLGTAQQRWLDHDVSQLPDTGQVDRCRAHQPEGKHSERPVRDRKSSCLVDTKAADIVTTPNQQTADAQCCSDRCALDPASRVSGLLLERHGRSAPGQAA